MTQKQIKNLNYPISTKENEVGIKNHSTKKTLSQYDTTSDTHQTFKEEIEATLHSLFQ